METKKLTDEEKLELKNQEGNKKPIDESGNESGKSKENGEGDEKKKGNKKRPANTDKPTIIDVTKNAKYKTLKKENEKLKKDNESKDSKISSLQDTIDSFNGTFKIDFKKPLDSLNEMLFKNKD